MQRQIIRISHMHTYIQRQNQQVNRRHIKITYLLTAPEPARGCLKLVNRSQLLVGQSSPYCFLMWGRYCCLTRFFPIVDTCLSCKDTARQSCAMVPRWQIFGDFLHPVFSVSHVQQVSDLHPKFALRPHHVCNLRWLRLGEEKGRRRR